MAYQFHYTPTGTGVISGKEVLEQTEDAINDLSGQISGDVQTAIDTANNALNTANTASVDAQNAINTASTAYTAATNAQNTANTAQNTASNALTAAQNAQNDVDALGNRVTTAEGNITQNTNAITGLTTRMGTAEGNIGNLQTAVSTAQATANSAQQTATTARQQSYVFRYSSTALTPSSTNSNALLDNTDNLKVGDKVIDSSGVLFSVTAIDTQNSTFTIGTALIDLAQDSDVMHLSGDESASGKKIFGDMTTFRGSYLGNEPSTSFRTCAEFLSRFDTKDKSGIFLTKFRSNAEQGALSGSDTAFITLDVLENGERTNAVLRFNLSNWNGNTPGTFSLYPKTGITSNLGLTANKWTKINGLNPGSLSLPDLSNGIDISGYFTLGTSSNNYTPIADGWICIKGVASSTTGAYVESTNGFCASAYSVLDIDSSSRFVNLCFPVVKDEQYTIVLKSITTSVTAKFYPCQGNV